MAKSLRVVSTSELSTFGRCAREHWFSYLQRRRPIERAEALTFGTVMHAWLEAWQAEPAGPTRLEAAFAVIDAAELSPLERAKHRALARGYHARWNDAELTYLEIELPFHLPIVNPATGGVMRRATFGGKIDAVVRAPNGRTYVMEHKSTSEDLSPGSAYVRKLRIDAQVSNYDAAMRGRGVDLAGTIYDIVGKPRLRPQLAAPAAEREALEEQIVALVEKEASLVAECAPAEALKKELSAARAKLTRASKAGRELTEPMEQVAALEVKLREYPVESLATARAELSAARRRLEGMRSEDEDPAAYEARIANAIAQAPDDYFARYDVVRLEADQREAAFDRYQRTAALLEAESVAHHPRNPDACRRYGRMCPYFDVCVGVATLDDDRLFYTAPHAHEELAAA
jgi:hypothetical protein